MKTTLALLALTTALSAGAQTQPAIATPQFGYSEVGPMAQNGQVADVIHLSGLSALAIYNGMNDITATPGLIANTTVRAGQNITCTVGLFIVPTCVLHFDDLATGKLQ